MHGGPIKEGGIGSAARRKEDLRLTTGKGCYADDVNLAGQAYAAFVRSPHSHARIVAIDIAAAVAIPGVLAVLTGADAAADGLRPLQHNWRPSSPPDIALNNRDGSAQFVSPHLPLPADKVRFIGEAVAMVVASSAAVARDAAELVAVDYDPLPAVVDAEQAVEAGAPQLWEGAARNTCIDADVGDHAATEAAFARAEHVVHLKIRVQRITGVHMEPRAALCGYDAADGRYTLYTGSGGVVRLKNELAYTLNVEPQRVRVIVGDVGGNFGTRNSIYPEFALVAWAARRCGRPVKWTATRSEAFLSDYQARDLIEEAELALDATGRFLAMRGSLISNVGAHTVAFIAIYKGAGLVTSVYDVPAGFVRARAVMSNTPPTHPYRSTGRPEVMLLMERLIDLAARDFGFDRVELRRRNLVAPQAMPYANPLGLTYDSGDYASAMESALAMADWHGFAARRQEARARGRYRGIGVANYIEVTSGAPRERAEITVMPEGRIDVVIGTLSSGQGHETSFAQLITEWLGVPADDVRLITGDTDVVPVGGGSHSGRSMRLAGIVIGKASQQIIETGRQAAAWLLEAAAEDITFAAGRFVLAGTDRAVGLFEVADAMASRDDLPAELRGKLSAECDEMHPIAGFPYGSQVCEVEVDPETGLVDIARYCAVDDVGRAVNPMILHGQAHGGIAQGVGQVLWEECVYDRDSGQLLAGSFLDYAMPRADRLPSFATAISEVPSPTNPLGIRAGGEGGTTPALAVVVNAIVDALAEFGVRHLDMPVTPERIWRAINGGAGERD